MSVLENRRVKRRVDFAKLREETRRMEPADQPTEGRLIEDARERSGLSQNEAARQAGMSGTRWRQIVNREAPTMTSRRGVRTLARMARVVGVDAGQLAGIGRKDVASELFDEGSEEGPSLEELAAEVAEVRRRNDALERRIAELEERTDPERHSA